MTTLPIAGYLSNAARTVAEQKQAFEDLRNFVAENSDAGRFAAMAGTATAMTAAFTPAFDATRLVDGAEVNVRATLANTTTTPTFTPNSGVITPRTMVKEGGAALAVGEVVVNGEYSFRYNLANTRWEVRNAVPLGRLIGIQVFTGTGTYTPTPGTRSVVVEMLSGGGGGGGAAATAAGQCAVGTSGGGGTYGRKRVLASFSGVTVTIGAGGAGGTAGNNNGANGGTTSFGAVASVGSSNGGVGGAVVTAFPSEGGGYGASATQSACDQYATGGPCLGGRYYSATAALAALGGASVWGQGAHGGLNSAGVSAGNYGAGGGGACNAQSQVARAGGNGSQGIVVVWEFS